jgi:outer membrane protein OmpA-like peptidoglycan-associated protein/tetratricopeptide (TPR) repeat protein
MFITYKKILLFISLLLLQGHGISAQSKNNKGLKKATTLYNQGERELLNGKVEKAISYFEKAIALNSNQAAYHRGLGTSYQLNNDFKKALEEFKTVLSLNPNFSRALYFEIAKLNFKVMNFEEALNGFRYYETLTNLSKDVFGINGEKEVEIEKRYIENIQKWISACKLAIDQNKYSEISTIQNLGEKINSVADEYFPFLTNDQNLLFFTHRSTAISDENLYYAQRSTHQWGDRLLVKGQFNTDANEGMSTFTRDGCQMFFTACNRKDVLGNCDIQVAYIDSTTVNSVDKLKGYSNSEYWESQASISCDGRVMFFASNRFGGFGGTDIWYSLRQGDDSWSDAINAGKNINTELDEEAPFITDDGETLYFSSTGHVGFGEQDLFFSRLSKDGVWGEVSNLGKPINTKYRELGFFLSAGGENGYFSSNRPGGFGGMDIYTFELPDHLYYKPITYIQGVIKDSLTRKIITNPKILEGKTTIPYDSLDGFFLCFPSNEKLSLEIFCHGYNDKKYSITIPEWENKENYSLEIFLVPDEKSPKLEKEKINTFIEDLYFEFDSSELSLQNKNSLSKLLEKTKAQSIHKISIKGFTDQKGNHKYNQELSERRAQAVADVLSSKGLIIYSIEVQGLGEVNSDLIDSSKRRVEITIETLD